MFVYGFQLFKNTKSPVVREKSYLFAVAVAVKTRHYSGFYNFFRIINY